MNFGIQFRVRGDSFGGHFINGISMADSESMWKCKRISADEYQACRNMYVVSENNKYLESVDGVLYDGRYDYDTVISLL